ncbi:MAG TPA: hypothetical protein VGR78_11740, partial [Verrucomicrobiae bacterium]|nr:hypothetical protein [Verrucomicrobiae bacterium]
MKQFSELQKRARACGIQISYLDNTGREQFASEETLRVLLQKLEAGAENEREARPRWTEPVVVCWRNNDATAGLRLDSRAVRRLKVFVESSASNLEQIARSELKWQPARSRGTETRLRFGLKHLPIGYYNL